MHRWSWELSRVTQGTDAVIGELADLSGQSITFHVDGSVEARFTLDATDPQAALVTEMTTDVRLLRSGVPIFRGRVGASQDEADQEGHTVTFTAVDYYTGILARRFNEAPWTFTGETQGSIVRQLLNYAFGKVGGNVGVIVGSGASQVPDTAITRTYTVETGKYINEAIAELGELENGFDFWISPTRVAKLAHPRRGIARDMALEFGSTVSKFRRTFDPADFANALMVTGKDATAPVFASAADMLTVPERRWESVVSLPDVDSTTVLQAMANQLLADRSVLNAAYSVTLAPNLWAPEVLDVGDTAQLVIRSGRLNVVKVDRVTQLALSLDDSGNETVEVTLGKSPPSLARRLRGYASRLDRVERLGP